MTDPDPNRALRVKIGDALHAALLRVPPKDEVESAELVKAMCYFAGSLVALVAPERREALVRYGTKALVRGANEFMDARVDLSHRLTEAEIEAAIRKAREET